MNTTNNFIEQSMKKSEQELLAAYEGGVNYYDTAYIYPGSEALLGEVLARNGIRDQVKIATKLPQYLIQRTAALDRYFEVMCDELTEEDIEDAFESFAPGNAEAVRKQFEDTGRRYAILEVARRLKAHKVLAANAVIHYQEIEVPVQHAHDGEEVDN